MADGTQSGMGTPHGSPQTYSMVRDADWNGAISAAVAVCEAEEERYFNLMQNHKSSDYYSAQHAAAVLMGKAIAALRK